MKTLGIDRIFYMIIAVLIILLVLCFGFHLKHINGHVFTVDNFGENDKPIICPRVKVDNIWYQFNGEFGENKSIHKAFIKPAVVKNYDCKRIFEKDEKYIKNLSSHRITYQDDPSLPTDCNSVRLRNYFPVLPNTREEAEYPIAYARVVYKDFLFLEMELAAEYAPQNFYCYVLDKKSNATFKQQIHNLGKCFPNVFVSNNEFDTDSSGQQMNYAYLE
uniref:Uncharacterized protein n=1 Tax=Acrobeloides nanus TaxID=290746 RepID=A0A914CHM5_9BILA